MVFKDGKLIYDEYEIATVGTYLHVNTCQLLKACASSGIKIQFALIEHEVLCNLKPSRQTAK